jgi:hypothetical protein
LGFQRPSFVIGGWQERYNLTPGMEGTASHREGVQSYTRESLGCKKSSPHNCQGGRTGDCSGL